MNVNSRWQKPRRIYLPPDSTKNHGSNGNDCDNDDDDDDDIGWLP